MIDRASTTTPTARQRALAIAALVLATAIWGSTFPVIQATMTHHLWLMLALRMFIGAGTVLILARGHCLGFPRSQRPLWIGLGLLIAIAFGAQTIGMTGTSIANSAVITALFIVFTPFFSKLLKKGDPTPAQWWGALIGISAFFVLGAAQGFSRLNLYDGLTLATALAVAIHTIYFGGAVARPGSLFNVVFYQFAGAACFLLLCHLLFEPTWVNFTQKELFNLTYLGASGCGVAFVLQAFAQRSLTPLQAALIIATEPLWAIAITRVVRGDAINAGAIAACALLILANIVAERRPGNSRAPDAGVDFGT
jgi:drug/metabolite transporter (DMT)-like permease